MHFGLSLEFGEAVDGPGPKIPGPHGAAELYRQVERQQAIKYSPTRILVDPKDEPQQLKAQAKLLAGPLDCAGAFDSWSGSGQSFKTWLGEQQSICFATSSYLHHSA
jgi:hypothetical protein